MSARFTNSMVRVMALTFALAAGFLVADYVSAQELDGPDIEGATVAELPEGMELLSRGPVHEAFADPLVAAEAPTIIVDRQPPEAIEELPPDSRPEDSIWIGGYWAWDDERVDFLWVSGSWRVPPPGQRWVPGYWAVADGGFSWIHGFWTADTVAEVSYLPPPPETLEEGPNSDAPNDESFWIPGNWEYQDTDYAWSPGYWGVSQPDWTWTPARYNWSPSGYVYCQGHWDYPLEDRGWLFSPVAFNQSVYTRPGFYYTPSVVINPIALARQLFVRPRYGSYYFGDYYAASYSNRGYTPYFQYGRRHYDPIFNYQRQHYGGSDRNWLSNIEQTYALRQRDPRARPPRVYNINNIQNNNITINNKTLAISLNQYVNRRDVRSTRVSRPERDQFASYSRELRQLQQQRRESENRRGRDGRDNLSAAGGRNQRAASFKLPDADRLQQLTGQTRNQARQRPADPDRRGGAREGGRSVADRINAGQGAEGRIGQVRDGQAPRVDRNPNEQGRSAIERSRDLERRLGSDAGRARVGRGDSERGDGGPGDARRSGAAQGAAGRARANDRFGRTDSSLDVRGERGDSPVDRSATVGRSIQGGGPRRSGIDVNSPTVRRSDAGPERRESLRPLSSTANGNPTGRTREGVSSTPNANRGAVLERRLERPNNPSANPRGAAGRVEGSASPGRPGSPGRSSGATTAGQRANDGAQLERRRQSTEARQQQESRMSQQRDAARQAERGQQAQRSQQAERAQQQAQRSQQAERGRQQAERAQQAQRSQQQQARGGQQQAQQRAQQAERSQQRTQQAQRQGRAQQASARGPGEGRGGADARAARGGENRGGGGRNREGRNQDGNKRD